jgi:hypothetical protein
MRYAKSRITYYEICTPEYNILFTHGNNTAVHKFVLSHTYNEKFWEELIAYFPLIRYGPQRKRHVQQFCHCCVFIRWRCSVLTEPLPSNDRGIHIQTQRDLQSMPLRSAQVPWYTYQVHKDWSVIKKLTGGDSKAHRLHGDLISLLLFFSK